MSCSSSSQIERQIKRHRETGRGGETDKESKRETETDREKGEERYRDREGDRKKMNA